MYSNHRPEFKNFPLSSQDIRQVNETKQSLQKEMQTNQREIQQLTMKASQNNYQTQLLRRLRDKSAILQQRMRQNQQMLALQATMEREIKFKKAQSLRDRKQLAEQYKSVMEEKRNQKEKLKERQKLMEREIQKKNQEIGQEADRSRKWKEQSRKKDYMASIEVMEIVKKEIREEKERSKRESNDGNQMLVRNDEQFEKHYKQYKQSFLANNNSSDPSSEATFYSNGVLSSTIDSSLMQHNMNNMEKYKRDQQHKLDLQDSLRQQMEWRDMKKQREREQNLFEKHMTDLHIMRNTQADRLEKQRKREMQKEYEQDLNRQVEIKEYLASREGWKRESKEKSLSKTGRMSNMAAIGNSSLQ